MDFVTRQFINLTKKLRNDLRKGLSILHSDLEKYIQSVNAQRRRYEKDDQTAKEQQLNRPAPILQAELHFPKDEQRQRQSENDRQYTLQFWLTLGTWLAFIAASVYGYFALRQWREMISARHQTELALQETRGANHTTKDALLLVQRAFVFVTPMEPSVVGTSPKNGGVEVMMKWENAGTTPTKEMREHVSFAVRNTALPDSFSFDDTWKPGEAHLPARVMIGPKGTTFDVAGLIPINDIQEWKLGRRKIYIWAWAEYRDVFDKTPLHITKYCAEMRKIQVPPALQMADPQNPPPLGWEHLTIRFDSCRQHNCYDEECSEKK